MTALENSSHSPRHNLIAGEVGSSSGIGIGIGNGQSQGSPSAIGLLKLQNVARGAAGAMAAFTRNSFALIGLSVLFMAIALVVHPELRQTGKSHLMGWLQDSHVATAASSNGTGAEPDESDAVERATATHPQSLPKQQAAVAYWLSKKYRVAPEPVSALVAEAYGIGARTKLDPHLILAIMAVESGFNPFAQSAVGAQGLMQVMTKIHSDKYEIFGGKLAAFDPLTNLRVGVKVLQECIARAGSLEAGLKFYVGAANIEDDGGYAAKVMAEHDRLKRVSAGRSVSLALPGQSHPPKATPSPALPTLPPQIVPAVLPAKADAALEKLTTLADS